MSRHILILGPAHPLRGGIAAFNERLAQAFTQNGDDCTIVSFKFQYPDFLFPGKTQYSTSPAPAGIRILPLVHSLNPANWVITANKIVKEKPDIILVRYWLPLLAPALGSILKLVRKKSRARIVCLADNILPHEKRPGDTLLTRYFLSACDAFLVMSEKVAQDLKSFSVQKNVQMVPHPLYDHFGDAISKDEARKALDLAPSEKVLLFFGFIRKYKGLDLLLAALAFPEVKALGVKLLIAGEFYEDEAQYRQMIRQLQLQDQVILKNDFIPDSEVGIYFCAADCVVQPYRSATQSGVTPLAYHFNKPMIVTNVGGLPDMVPHSEVGLVCNPEPQAIATAIRQFYGQPSGFFDPYIASAKKQFAWEKMVQAITELGTNN